MGVNRVGQEWDRAADLPFSGGPVLEDRAAVDAYRTRWCTLPRLDTAVGPGVPLRWDARATAAGSAELGYSPLGGVRSHPGHGHAHLPGEWESIVPKGLA